MSSKLAKGECWLSTSDYQPVRLIAEGADGAYQLRHNGLGDWGAGFSLTADMPVTIMLHENDEIKNVAAAEIRVEV